MPVSHQQHWSSCCLEEHPKRKLPGQENERQGILIVEFESSMIVAAQDSKILLMYMRLSSGEYQQPLKGSA